MTLFYILGVLSDRALGLNVGEQRRITETYGQLPLAFESNWGQSSSPAAFLVRCRNHTVFLESDALTFALYSRQNAVEPVTSQVVRIGFEGAKSDAPLQGLEKLPGLSNYFIGQDPRRWHTNIPQYGRVSASEVYPGITLNLHSTSRTLEYDFLLSAGADFRNIRLRVDGAQQMSLNERGDLLLQVSGGQLVQTRPYAYQLRQGVRYSVTAEYRILDDRSVVFDIGAYDRQLPLTIDPSFAYSTQFGGQYSDNPAAIAVDQTGAAYIAGLTASPDFPTVHAIQASMSPSLFTAFVTKLNPSGNAVVYSTYLGGSLGNTAHSIAVDASGAYVIGDTSSTDFPIVNPLLSSPAPGWIAKLNAAGSALAYSSYFYGTGAIAVNAGAAYVQGGITTNAFFSKIDPTGTSINFSTQFGDGTDRISAIAVHSVTGDVVVVGSTASLTFPTLNAFQSTRAAGGRSGFVTKFNSAGTSVIYSTYLGGSTGGDGATSVTLDASGAAYVGGAAESYDFPVTSGAVQPLKLGDLMCFVTKFGTNGDFLLSTLLGGAGACMCSGFAVDSSGDVLVGGTAFTNFPLVGTLQAVSSAHSAFVTKLKPDFSALTYSIAVGSNSQGQALALDANGNAYLAAIFGEPGPYPVVNSPTFGVLGDWDGAVSKIVDDTVCASLNVSPSSFTFDRFGGSGSVNVAAPSACKWSVVINSFALGLSVPDAQFPYVPFSGNGTVDFSVAGIELNHPTAVGYLVIAGRRVKITQTGFSPTPLLRITKSHSGNFPLGQQNAQYTVLVSNDTGGAPTSGAVIVTETVPPGMTLASMAGTGWTCPGTSANNCSRNDALNGGASYSPIVVKVNVALNAGSLISNQVTVSGGGSATASGEDVTGIGGPQNFSLSVSPGSESVAAGVKNIYTVTVTGINAFSGTLSFGVSGLPSGVTASFLPATLTGPGSTILMFTTTAATPKGTFTLTVTGTSGMLSHSASASLTVTESRAALSIIKMHTANFVQGQQNASYSVLVLNAANATPTSGTVTVTETLPPGLTLHAMFGTGWACASNTCSRSDVLGTGGTYESITVLVNVASNATSPQVNQVSVSGGGSATASTSDSTPIDDFASRSRPRLGVSKGGIWFVDMDGNGQLSGNEIFGWGVATDTPVLGDWNRSGTTKAGVFRNGLWFLDLNGNHQLTSSSIIGWGQPADIPVVGDWIQSGPQIGVFRNGIWFLDLFGNHQLTDQRQIVGWGQAGDVPVVGDWNGQGATKIGVFRNGLWFLDTDGTHQVTSSKIIGWGQAGDIPVLGDWNGDGRTKIGVFRKGYWFLDVAGDHQLVQSDIVGWGQPNDIPVVGDWDNSGTTKIGVYRSGTWFLDISGNHQLTSPTQILSWGKAGDKPEPGHW